MSKFLYSKLTHESRESKVFSTTVTSATTGSQATNYFKEDPNAAGINNSDRRHSTDERQNFINSWSNGQYIKPGGSAISVHRDPNVAYGTEPDRSQYSNAQPRRQSTDASLPSGYLRDEFPKVQMNGSSRTSYTPQVTGPSGNGFRRHSDVGATSASYTGRRNSVGVIGEGRPSTGTGQPARQIIRSMILNQAPGSTELVNMLIAEVEQKKISDKPKSPFCKFCRNNHEEDIYHNFKVREKQFVILGIVLAILYSRVHMFQQNLFLFSFILILAI